MHPSLPLRVLVAPQAFKGTLAAARAAAALGAGARRAPDVDVDECPMADGGDGTVEVLVRSGAERRTAHVSGPLTGQVVEAAWALRRDDATAVVELAEASGLRLVPPAGRDVLRASTSGTGEVIRHALDAGVRRVVVAVGGSATVDGGAGLLQALGYRLLDGVGRELPPGGGSLDRLATIDDSHAHAALRAAEVIVAVDVDNPLLGPEGAAAVYGPQKGAAPADVLILERGLARLAAVVEAQFGRNVRGLPGGGAAGGTAAGLAGVLGARIELGFDQIARATRLPERIRASHLVLTGEGQLDSQSLRGKTSVSVARLARDTGKPCVAIVGGWLRGDEPFDLFAAVLAARGPSGRADEASLADTAEAVVRLVRLGNVVSAGGRSPLPLGEG